MHDISFQVIANFGILLRMDSTYFMLNNGVGFTTVLNLAQRQFRSILDERQPNCAWGATLLPSLAQ
jgi:hypothetical protein